MASLQKYKRLQEADTILIEDVISLTCCPVRTKDLQNDPEGYNVKVMIHVENPSVNPPHCQLGCINRKQKREI